MPEVDLEKLIADGILEDEKTLARVLGRRVTHPAYGAGRIVGVEKSEEDGGTLISIGFGKLGKVFPLADFRREFLRNQYVMNQPSAPDMDVFTEKVKGIFGSRWLTNFGGLHEEFSGALGEILDAEFVLPVTNATFGIMTLLNAMDLRGEILTVP